jgi:hypothetical protein
VPKVRCEGPSLARGRAAAAGLKQDIQELCVQERSVSQGSHVRELLEVGAYFGLPSPAQDKIGYGGIHLSFSNVRKERLTQG